MQIVYEVILLNKILRNHLLSENMQWNYASFNVTLNYLMHEIMEFCVTSSLAFDNCEPKYCQTLGNKAKPSTPFAARTIIFQRKNLNCLIVCSTQCTLFFRKVCLTCFICGSYVTKINAALWHSARQTFASLGLFNWLVHVGTYCVPIATLNQNKRTRLLYLGDAQTIKGKLDASGYMLL